MRNDYITVHFDDGCKLVICLGTLFSDEFRITQFKRLLKYIRESNSLNGDVEREIGNYIIEATAGRVLDDEETPPDKRRRSRFTKCLVRRIERQRKAFKLLNI